MFFFGKGAYLWVRVVYRAFFHVDARFCVRIGCFVKGALAGGGL